MQYDFQQEVLSERDYEPPISPSYIADPGSADPGSADPGSVDPGSAAEPPASLQRASFFAPIMLQDPDADPGASVQEDPGKILLSLVLKLASNLSRKVFS